MSVSGRESLKGKEMMAMVMLRNKEEEIRGR